jgi:hypothetical protein
VPVENVHLITRPSWGDVATDYGYLWYQSVVDDMLKLGIDVVDMVKELDRKDPVHEATIEKDPSYWTGIGHGNADVYTGQRTEVLFRTCNGDEILADRITYLLSCMTAQRLGQDIIDKGGRAYLGYWVSYTFVVDGRMEADNVDKCFKDTSNVISKTVAKGRNGTIGSAQLACKGLAKLWIAFCEIYGSASQIKWLNHNYFTITDSQEPQQLKGDSEARVSPTVTHRTTVDVIRLTRFEKGTAFPVQICVRCPEGCSLLGRTVQLVDHNGEVKAETTLTSFDEEYKINSTAILTVQAPSELGKFTWTSKCLGDEAHPAEEQTFDIFTTGTGTVQGKVTDAKTGQPIANARVSGGGGSATTNENGEYSMSIEVPGTWDFACSHMPEHYSQTKTLDCPEEKTYTLDFQLKPRPLYAITTDSTPMKGVLVEIDRKPVGKTPVTVSLYEGISYRVEVPAKHDNYEFVQWENGRTTPYRYIYPRGEMSLMATYKSTKERRGAPSESPVVTVTIHPKAVPEPTVLTLAPDKTEYTSGDPMVLSGTLTFKEEPIEPLPGRTVTIEENDVPIGTATTTEDGSYVFDWTAPEVTEERPYNYKAKFAGDPTGTRKGAPSASPAVSIAQPSR